MRFIVGALLPLLAVASPALYRRQDLTSSASGAILTITDAASSAVASATGLSSDSGIAASSLASASASVSSGLPFPQYPCDQGGLLTYAEAVQAYPGVALSDAVTAQLDWANSAPFPANSTSGTNETGATRSFSVLGYQISEVLINQTVDALGGLESTANLTKPVMGGGLTIYSAFTVSQIYSNTTSGETTGKIFSNFCTSSQNEGQALAEQLFTAVLAARGQAAASGTASSVASAPMSGMSAASSAVASASSEILSSASDLASSATALATSAAA